MPAQKAVGMSIVSIENIRRRYRVEPVLDGVSLGVERGDKVGFIGANGCGKSTLLRIMSGREAPDSGRVVFARGIEIAYLAQNPTFDPDLTVLDAVFAASSEIMTLLHDYEQACQAVSAGDEASLSRMSDLAAALEARGAWDLETNARTVLNHLSVPDVNARIGSLSGGGRKRVALAHALITRPDLLILDEPTNHLDTDAIAWLERYLQGFTGTLLLVTHDRYFLDRVTNRTVEVEKGQVQTFVGCYADYLERKAEREAQQAVTEEKRDALIRSELAWLRKGPRARATKQKARIERAHALMDAPREEKAGTLDISLAGRRLGGKTIEMKGVSKRFDGEPVINEFTYTLKKGERIGIVGPNGSGKTTLLELMSGRLSPDAGSVEIGSTVVIGYYDQESRALDDDLKVIDYIRDVSDAIRTADGKVFTAEKMCERFLFTGAMQHAPIARLSGGERRRLYLLRVLMMEPNVLLLDEPTNDLDIPTLVRLEDHLDSFGGCLVVVSHDRYFLDRTTESTFAFEGSGRIREYAGTFSDTLEARTAAAAAPVAEALSSRGGRAATSPSPPTSAPAPSAPTQKPPQPRKLTFRETRELASLETEIEAGEARRKALEAMLATESSDYALTQKRYDELQTLTQRLDHAMERWTELSELA